MTDMPADPFLPGDATALGAAAYNLFAGLVQGGFAEPYALELVKGVLIALMLNSLAQSQQPQELCYNEITIAACDPGKFC